MKTKSFVGVAALATMVTAGACVLTTTPESASEDAGVQGRVSADGGGGDRTGAAVLPPDAPEKGALATFTPAEVANIVDVINFGEVTQGQLATQQAVNPEVKAFAQHMVDSHGKGELRILKLLGPTPTGETQATRLQGDPTASILQHQGQILTNDLKTQTGAAFDLAYMTGQIADHAKVIGLIDRSLLPSVVAAQTTAAAQNATAGSSTGETTGQVTSGTVLNATDLRAELETTRTEVANHLVEALRIQKALRPIAATPTPGATPPPGATPGATPPPGATLPPGSTPPPR